MHHNLAKQVLPLLNIIASLTKSERAFNIYSHGLFGEHLSYGNQSTVLRCDRMEWDLSDKLQPSESTYNLHPPRFPFLVGLQTLIEVFANGNHHCIVFESSIRITE